MSREKVDEEIATHFARALHLRRAELARIHGDEQHNGGSESLLAEELSKIDPVRRGAHRHSERYDDDSDNGPDGTRHGNLVEDPAAAFAIQVALGVAADSCLGAVNAGSSSSLPEVFSARRAGLHQTSRWASLFQSGAQAVRVVGFVQDIDTESQLVQARPDRFLSSIVCDEQSFSVQMQQCDTQSSNSDNRIHGEVLVECTSLFVTPIPGFEYDCHVTDRGAEPSVQQPQRRSLVPPKKRARGEADELSAEMNIAVRPGDVDDDASDLLVVLPDGAEHLAAGGESVSSRAESLKKHKVEQEQNEKKRKEAKPSALQYPDQREPEEDTQDGTLPSSLNQPQHRPRRQQPDRCVWRDLLGLSVQPVHESLATGVVAILPQSLEKQQRLQQQHVSDKTASAINTTGSSLDPAASTTLDLLAASTAPRLFDTVEIFGFLISPAVGEAATPSSENDDEHSTIPMATQYCCVGDDHSMSSRFHRVPYSVAPRLVIVAWRPLPSLDAAHALTCRSSDNSTSTSTSSSSTVPVQPSLGLSATSSSSQLFGDLLFLLRESVFGGSEAAAACYLLHLVSAVTVRDTSGAFGDLPLALLCFFPRDSSISSSSSSQRDALSAAFLSKLEAVSKALRPGTVLCECTSNKRSRKHLACSTEIDFTRATAVIPRLEYDEQAVSSCAFSLPRGSELIVSDLLLPCSPSTTSSRGGSNSLGCYSENVNALADLMIQQRLPVRFGLECEIAIERDLGLLFVGTKQSTGAGDAASQSANLVGADVFVPLRCAVPLAAPPSAERGEREHELEIPTHFSAWFQHCRQLYRTNNTSSNSGRSCAVICFEEPQRVEQYFLANVDAGLGGSGAGWSTAMIKHSVPNTLLTMARARAVLDGRRAVRNSDIDQVKQWLIAARLSAK